MDLIPIINNKIETAPFSWHRMTQLEFLLKAAHVRAELARLLQLNLSAAPDTQLQSLLNSLVHRWLTDDKEFSELDVVRLEYLIKHLKEIELYDLEMLRTFIREFRRAKTQDNLEGVRFECYAAASLARKGLRFQKSEAPDFNVYDQNASLECASVRLARREPLKDLSYKISAAIASKEKTKSNKEDVVLLVDVTNILHASDLTSVVNLRPVAQERITRTLFASIVMICHVFEEKGRAISTNYIREDNTNISDQMLGFLDFLYPKGCVRIYDFYVPVAG